MSNYQKFIIKAIWNNCYKIARVNVLDGRYHFFKKFMSAEEEQYLTAPNFTEYVQRIVDDGWIYPEDAEAYKRIVQPEYLRETILKRRVSISETFRRLIINKYYWMTLETIIPEDFSEENPWVLFLWKDADAQAGLVIDSMRMLTRLYYKIVKVNITTCGYEVIKEATNLGAVGAGGENFFEDHCVNTIKIGLVHQDDKDEFLKFFNRQNFINCFMNGAEEASCVFRRLFGDEYRWVKCYVYRSYEYTEENKVVLVYMRDVNERYQANLMHQSKLEYYAKHDELTGLFNRRMYNDHIACHNGDKNSVGVFYADLNGLKYFNDNYGHSYGDKFILSFSNTIKRLFGTDGCYRISGDEFVVIFHDITKEQFNKNFVALDAALLDISHKISEYGLGERTVASVGCAWSQNCDSLESVVAEAEADMYKKKALYYQVHPDFKRIS